MTETNTGERRFLAGPQSRRFDFVHALRIFAEYVRGIRALHFVGPCVTVFGSARLGENDPGYALGRETGRLLSEAGFTVMTGGGPGLMEAANRGARDVNGRSIGCNIRLPVGQVTNRYVDHVLTFEHFFVRKVMLVKYSYGFIALPGGLGTFDEIFEAATLIQTGKILDFPIVLLDHSFWDPVLDVLETDLITRRTIEPRDLARLVVTDSPREAVEHIRSIASDKLGLVYTQQPRRWWLGER